MISKIILHLVLNVVTSISFLKIEVSIPGFWRNIVQSFSLIFLFLNQLSPFLGKNVAFATIDSVSISLTSTISTSTPLNAQLNALLTSTSYPSKCFKEIKSSHFLQLILNSWICLKKFNFMVFKY